MIHKIAGVKCGGIKEGKCGVGIIVCRGKIVAMFTKNKVKAAPIKFNLRNLSEDVEGIIVNSGNANAFTGEEGVKKAEKMAEFLAKKLGCEKSKIAVASTGVIGEQLDLDVVLSLAERVYQNLGSDEDSALSFARAIMTTDRYPKMSYTEARGVKVAGIAKGAGMIAPNMATMLAFIITNAKMSVDDMRKALKKAVDRSFNVAVVDGDTSTNDSVFLISTGEVEAEQKLFEELLTRVCVDLARQIVRDGEGARKLITFRVKGAVSDEEAFRAAKTVASSLLVKTAFFGEDPNFGRIVAALGRAGVEMDENISISFVSPNGEAKVVERGRVVIDVEVAKRVISSDEVEVVIDLHKGDGEGFAFGCDLGYEYVRINSEYTT